MQAQTVRLWTVGVTIGPVDPENVRRIGVVADEHRLVENYSRIYAAMELFRNAHAVLGRRIGDMARFYGTAAVAGRVDADEILDQRSGLTVADFRDCMEIMEISAVEPCGVVPRAVLDRIQTQQEDESMTATLQTAPGISLSGQRAFASYIVDAVIGDAVGTADGDRCVGEHHPLIITSVRSHRGTST